MFPTVHIDEGRMKAENTARQRSRHRPPVRACFKFKRCLSNICKRIHVKKGCFCISLRYSINSKIFLKCKYVSRVHLFMPECKIRYLLLLVLTTALRTTSPRLLNLPILNNKFCAELVKGQGRLSPTHHLCLDLISFTLPRV